MSFLDNFKNDPAQNIDSAYSIGSILGRMVSRRRKNKNSLEKGNLSNAEKNKWDEDVTNDTMQLANQFATFATNMVKKSQQGGTVDPNQFPAWLAQVFGAQNEEELQQIVQKIGKDGLKQFQELFAKGATPEEVKQMLAQQGQPSYRNGGLIQSYTNLIGICPPGYERKFKAGGKCPVCEKKKLEAAKGAKFFKNGKRIK